MRGGDYGSRFSDNYDGRYGRPSGPISREGRSPDWRSGPTGEGDLQSPLSGL
jgi:hypothetical protein